jgi:general secretion pathway protein K
MKAALSTSCPRTARWKTRVNALISGESTSSIRATGAKTCMAGTSPATTSNDGFIVIAVLWILGALATLVSIYAVFVIESAASFASYDDHLRAEALISGALELTAYRVKTAEPPSGRGRFEVRLGQANVEVEFLPETARVDLNAASKELFVALFTAMGAPRGQAEYYADRIIAWRTPPRRGDDAERSAYQSAGLRYAPRGAPFPDVNELALVLGLPIALVERILPLVTVYNGRPQVHVLAAAPDLIAALPGMTRERADALLALRDTVIANRQVLMQSLGPSQRYATADNGKAWRVTVRVTFDSGRRLDAEVVIFMLEEDPEPFSILAWRDDSDESAADRSASHR